MRPFTCCLVLLMTTAVASADTRLEFAQPGYALIDGSYHVFDLPTDESGPVPAELRARDVDGFYLRANLVANDCRDGGSELQGASLVGLRHAEVLDLPDAPLFDLQPAASGALVMTLASCDGAIVLIANTPGGDTSCGGAIGFPFRRGQCPGLDAADRGHVFFDAFE